MSVNTLQFFDEKTAEEATFDSEGMYGVVTLEADAIQQEAQNITTQVWYGENGEEAYIPSSCGWKAYDYTFTLGVKATGTSTAIENKDDFINDIKGTLWDKIYQPYTHHELNSAYLSKVEDDEVTDSYVTFKCTFHVTKP